MTCLVISQAPAFNRRQLSELAQTKFMDVLRLYEVFVGHYLAAIEVSNDDRFVNHMFNCYGCIIDHTCHKGRYRDIWVVLDFIQIVLDYLATILVSRRINVNLAIEATRAQERGIKRIRNVGSTNG